MYQIQQQEQDCSMPDIPFWLESTNNNIYHPEFQQLIPPIVDQQNLLVTTSYSPIEQVMFNHDFHFYYDQLIVKTDIISLSSPASSSYLPDIDSFPELEFDFSDSGTAIIENIEVEPRMIDSFVLNQQERRFVCQLCPRSFARKHDRQRHERVHTGIKPYSCPCCTKAFARTDALKRHLRMEDNCRMSPIVQALTKNGTRRYRNL